MSIYNCHKQQPQPWMSYISQNNITFTGDCCPHIITGLNALLPFQIISEGDFVKAEISPHGENTWTEIDLTIDTVISDGFFIHSYDGSDLDTPLECGIYDFRVDTGDMWWFEPIMVQDFTIAENAYTIRDDLMLPLKFAEQQIEGIPVIAPCDSFLPFMFATDNATSGNITIYLYDGECSVSEVTNITVDVMTIGGKTYYIYDGSCFTPFLECGLYKLEIVDGEHSYMSVWFEAVCDWSDIPDGYRPMLDANRCVMRDANGVIEYEPC